MYLGLLMLLSFRAFAAPITDAPFVRAPSCQSFELAFTPLTSGKFLAKPFVVDCGQSLNDGLLVTIVHDSLYDIQFLSTSLIHHANARYAELVIPKENRNPHQPLVLGEIRVTSERGAKIHRDFRITLSPTPPPPEPVPGIVEAKPIPTPEPTAAIEPLEPAESPDRVHGFLSLGTTLFSYAQTDPNQNLSINEGLFTLRSGLETPRFFKRFTWSFSVTASPFGYLSAPQNLSMAQFYAFDTHIGFHFGGRIGGGKPSILLGVANLTMMVPDLSYGVHSITGPQLILREFWGGGENRRYVGYLKLASPHDVDFGISGNFEFALGFGFQINRPPSPSERYPDRWMIYLGGSSLNFSSPNLPQTQVSLSSLFLNLTLESD